MDNSCSSSCSYRRLYESSQISLSDMSAKQAGALARVGRLRAALVSVLRKNFPTQANEFERSCGMRLSDMDDELILAFLEGVVNTNNSRDAKTTLMVLGQALISKGIVKDISRPVTWIDDVVNFEIGVTKSNDPAKAGENLDTHQQITDQTETAGVGNDGMVVTNTTPTRDPGEKNTSPSASNEAQVVSDLEEATNIKVDEVLGWSDNSKSKHQESLADLFRIDLSQPETLGQNYNSWSPSPLKPELAQNYTKLASKEKKQVRRKEIRVQANSPKQQTKELSGVLDDRLRGVFLAASTIPRPVFVKDLLSICEDISVITIWEEESRANADIGLRFISPKQRHRQRGSLIVPSKNIRTIVGRHSEDWWNAAMDLYMGSKLYELGVLLHRVGDEIVSYRFNEHLAIVKVNTSKGIVALIVLMNDRIEKGTQTRNNLIEVIKEASHEKIAYVAVLTTLGEDREIDRLISNLVEINNEEDLDLTCPLVCAKSWEYSDSRGSTAIQITN